MQSLEADRDLRSRIKDYVFLSGKGQKISKIMCVGDPSPRRYVLTYFTTNFKVRKEPLPQKALFDSA